MEGIKGIRLFSCSDWQAGSPLAKYIDKDLPVYTSNRKVDLYFDENKELISIDGGQWKKSTKTEESIVNPDWDKGPQAKGTVVQMGNIDELLKTKYEYIIAEAQRSLPMLSYDGYSFPFPKNLRGGCYYAAHFVAEKLPDILKNYNISYKEIKKIGIVDNPYNLAVTGQNGKEYTWSNHVAPLVILENGNKYVFDIYAQNNELLSIEEWVNYFSKTPYSQYTDITNIPNKKQYLNEAGMINDNQKIILEMKLEYLNVDGVIQGLKYEDAKRIFNIASSYMLKYHLLDKAEKIDDFVKNFSGTNLEQTLLNTFPKEDIAVFCGSVMEISRTPLMNALLKNDKELEIAANIFFWFSQFPFSKTGQNIYEANKNIITKSKYPALIRMTN